MHLLFVEDDGDAERGRAIAAALQHVGGGVDPLDLVAALDQLQHRCAVAAGDLERGRTRSVEERDVVVRLRRVADERLVEFGDEAGVELGE